MRVHTRLWCLPAACLVTIAAVGAIPAAAAAPLPLGSLLLRAHDLGAGYYDQYSGYSSDRSVILQPGIPVPGQIPTLQQLRQHGFTREFVDRIWSKRMVNNRLAADIGNSGDRFTTAAGAHWEFQAVKRLRHIGGLFSTYRQVARVGDESFGVLAMGCGSSCTGIVFRQGRYLVFLYASFIAPPPLQVAALARIVAGRIQQHG